MDSRPDPRPAPQGAEHLHQQGTRKVAGCGQTHEKHAHVHGDGCGHPAVRHDDHVDYLHDGHLHHPHSGHLDEHALAETERNPAACTPEHTCEAHDELHRHGKGCGHELVPHGDHHDYLVGNHLHHPHDTEHCDDHGPIDLERVAWLSPGGP
jgi:hypothetical protein